MHIIPAVTHTFLYEPEKAKQNHIIWIGVYNSPHRHTHTHQIIMILITNITNVLQTVHTITQRDDTQKQML